MQRSLRLSLSLSGVAALALAGTPLLPAIAQDVGSADDLGVMEINLKDAVKFNWGFQGALQGAGIPNQATNACLIRRSRTLQRSLKTKGGLDHVLKADAHHPKVSALPS